MTKGECKHLHSLIIKQVKNINLHCQFLTNQNAWQQLGRLKLIWIVDIHILISTIPQANPPYHNLLFIVTPIGIGVIGDLN